MCLKNMKHYKAAILVLASEGVEYNQFREMQGLYLNSHQDFVSYFVYAGPCKRTADQYDLVYSDLKESLIQPHATKKVVRAIEHLYNNYQFDYLLRTNLSTFWNLDKLSLRLDTLPKTNLLCGTQGGIPPAFVIGRDMIVSKDLVKLLVDTPYKPYYEYTGKYIAEDRILSEFFQQCGAPIVRAEKSVVNIDNLQTWDLEVLQQKLKKYPNVDHYRIKNLADRSIDIQVMRYLLETIYKISKN